MGPWTYDDLERPTFLHSPRAGRDVCIGCFNLTRGFARCFACSRTPAYLSAMLPVSYSVGHEYLHHLLAAYKRLEGPTAEAAASQIRTILSRFLAGHEACVATAAGVGGFDLLTVIPSSHPGAGHHPLEGMIRALVPPVRGRYETLLRRSQHPVRLHRFDPRRFDATRGLDGENVLLIDDTWTTGASAQGAAAALRVAGAATVAAVVVGRHLNRGWYENDRRIDQLGFDWTTCAICAARAPARKAA